MTYDYARVREPPLCACYQPVLITPGITDQVVLISRPVLKRGLLEMNNYLERDFKPSGRFSTLPYYTRNG
jgi:hypothetical protein